MCSVAPDIMDKLDKSVKQFLEEGRMFTAYDVTLETRSRERMFLKHESVNGACHEIEALVDALDFGYADAQGRQTRWKKTQRNIPGKGQAWAWIYHPETLDPNGYQFMNTGAPVSIATAAPKASIAPAAPASLAIAQDGNTSDSGGEQDDGSFAVDFRNRLMIPTRYMREAGITAGDECFIIADATTNTVLICKNTPTLQMGGLKVTTQKVEKDGELRLSSKTLRAADLTDNKFVIENINKDFSGSKTKVVAVKGSDD